MYFFYNDILYNIFCLQTLIMAKRGGMKIKLLTLENVIGFILAMLIVMDLKIEKSIAHVINSPVGLVLCLIIFIAMSVTMNPFLGLLFLIYVYETVKYSSILQDYTQPIEKVKQNVMNRLNLGNEVSKDQVELNVIKKMAPIVKKSENRNAKFTPLYDDKPVYSFI